MKIAVVGAGAMGSLYAAMLAEAGNAVWICDVWQEQVQASKQQRIANRREGNTRSVRISATLDSTQIGSADLVIIFVKSTQTKSAAVTARYLVGSNGAVLTLQNGMGNAEAIAAYIAPERILAGTTAHGATMLGPGHIRHAGVGATTLGAWKNTDQGHGLARRFADVLQ